MRHLLNAALSKVVATIATYPLQVVQTRRRAGGQHSSSSDQDGGKTKDRYADNDDDDDDDDDGNLIAQLSSLVRRDGMTVLFSGLESKLVQTCLNAAIMFLVYEELSNQVYRVAGVVDR
jgi:adenine nucleotide transporter 17